MALFTDPQWNARTGRAEMHFVNQQYDLILVVAWDPAIGEYAFDVGLEEAERLARACGRTEFDASAELHRQAVRLLEMERAGRPPPK